MGYQILVFIALKHALLANCHTMSKRKRINMNFGSLPTKGKLGLIVGGVS
jgi:hypothetical protein